MDLLHLADWSEPAKLAIMTAVLLLTAVVGIRLARLTHIPRVVAYLLVGIGLRLALPCLVPLSEGESDPLGHTLELVHVIKTLALCLILFTIGASFDGSHLKAIGRHLWKISVAEIVTVTTLVFLATWLIGGAQPMHAVFLAIAALATAPAATLMVLRQYGAKGPATDHIVTLTGLNNLAAIVLFYVAFLVFAALGPQAGGLETVPMDRALWANLLLATAGSALFGALLGLLLSLLHIRLTRFETTLAFLGLMMILSVAAEPLHIPYNSLIVAMFAGLTFVNFSIQPHQFLGSLEPLTSPIFALFFILAGFDLKIAQLPHIGTVGVVFLIARIIGKVGGTAWGVRWVGPHHRVPYQLGTALLCQAGVAIGLGEYLIEHWGHSTAGHLEPAPDALELNTIILASVAFFELVGPLATKRAVVRAGEVKAFTLFGQPSGSLREVRTILMRLRRTLRRDANIAPESLTVRHVMRTNIDSLRQTAKMSEVLHHVEHSRFNHFFVVDADGHLIGTIDFKHLRNLAFNPLLAQVLNAYDMANTAPPLALADQSLHEVLDIFHEHDVGSLPVIENAESRRLLGVVEQRDVLRTLHADEGGSDDDSPQPETDEN